MPVETSALALSYGRRHPEAVARLLDAMSAADSAAVLADWPAPLASEVLLRMTPAAGAATLRAAPSETAASWLATVSRATVAGLLRPIESDVREPILSALPEAAILRTILSQPPDTAAAVMRSDVLTMRGKKTVNEAIELIRANVGRLAAALYVIDDESHLLGTVALRQLLVASPTALLQELAESTAEPVPASASIRAVVRHSGWLQIHELPVCDAAGMFLGVIDYPTLRRLELDLQQHVGAKEAVGATANALGDLFTIGVYGALDGAIGKSPAKGKLKHDE